MIGHRTLTVACVLKWGGDFDGEYVRILAKGVKKHLPLPYSFVCLTDMMDEIRDMGILAIPLEKNWPGWWSKMELYRLPGPVLYFDLDTRIVGSISRLAEYVSAMPTDELLMLRGFYRGDSCSGILGWNGRWLWLFHEFCTALEQRGKYVKRRDYFEFAGPVGRFRSDQEYLRRVMKITAMKIVLAQDVAGGIYSYKVHVRETGKIPTDANIICFHGKPRPTEIEQGIFVGE